MSNPIRPIAVVLAVVVAAGCGDDGPTEPGDLGNETVEGTPEDLVDAIEQIYSDIVRDAAERLDAYENLFPPPDHATLPGFIFRLQADDVVAGLPESWGLDEELAIHERMFGAQDAREIFQLSVSIEHLPAEPLDDPRPGQETWRTVLATNCNLRLLFNPDDGLEVVGGQGEFIAAPTDHRWYLVEWVDLPRPGGALPADVEVVGGSWGQVKAVFREAPVIPPPTRPENLVEAIGAVYSDTFRRATERVAAYASLFPPPEHPALPGFLFRLQPDDVIAGLPESWGRDQEIAIHERMFAAQDAGEIFALTASIESLPPEPLEFPEPGQEAWQSVFATHCNLRLLFNPDDGLEIIGGQATFIAAPADDRWYLVQWTDLPRPGGALPPTVPVEAATWGSIKASYK